MIVESPSERERDRERDRESPAMEERQPKRAKFAEASSSSTSVIGNNYYIFLSFRGPDTRMGFIDHLYHRLQDVGLPLHPNFVFRDDMDLPFGEEISSNLISAITHSKVSIPVISENYAGSEWCLRELIHIMECWERGEQMVLPVLYKVKPYEVRELRGAFGKVFKSRMHRFKKDVQQRGPEALRKLVSLRLIESEKLANGHEGKLVREVIEIIMREQQHEFPPSLPVDLVGIDDHVAQVMKLAATSPSETQTIVIYGIGGIGKTTLATVMYKKLSDKFECCSFLKDTRETIKSKGIEHVQSLLISEINKSFDSRVRNSERAIGTVRHVYDKKKALILLDDVDGQDHIDKLIGCYNFELGSRIIITCREKTGLKSEYNMYELQELNYKDSQLLFSRYAFDGERCPRGLQALSRDIVVTTRGLPLALVIVGSLLKGEPTSIWTEMLKKLRKVPNKYVLRKLPNKYLQKMLRIGFDSLEYEEQQMFLDIACFFIEIDKRIITYLWEDLKLGQDYGLDRMVELSLIRYDDENELRMHDQLRDLGRALACPPDKKPWDCSRLWDEEAITVQLSKVENRNIEALRLDKNGSSMFMNRKSFKNMPYLKFLHLSEVDFVGNFEDSLLELKWLEWKMCPDSFTATNVHLKKLLVLDLSGGLISENWEGWSSIKMERLKVLNLSGCRQLTSTPNLSAFKSLEMLILKNCTNLKRIDPSIGDVKHLISLNLNNCERLQVLPDSLKALGELRHLSLGRCYVLTEIPPSIGELGELAELDLSCTWIKKLPDSIGKLKKLEILRISHSEIKKIPSAIGELEGLQELDASGCQKLEGQIPEDICGLSFLKTLRLGSANISHLPEKIRELSNLDHLDLLYCNELQSLPEPSSRLSSLQLTCWSRTLPSLSDLSYLKTLTLHSCIDLESIPKLPSSIQKLSVSKCPKLETLPDLSSLKSLLELELVQCYRLMEFDGLEGLKSLRKLDVSANTDSSNLDPRDFELLRYSILQSKDAEADNLREIRGLGQLKSLEVLNISARKHIEVLDLSKSENLKRLIVKNCESLVKIRCHDKIKSLEHFDRDGCKSLKEVPDFLEDIMILEGKKQQEAVLLCDAEL